MASDLTPEELAELRTWYRMATDRGDAKVSRAQAQAELWNLLTCNGRRGPLDRIRMGEGILPRLLDMAERKCPECEAVASARFSRDCQLREAWPAIHRVLVAARTLMQCPRCIGPCDDPTVHAELAEALRALDDKEQRT